MKVGSGNGRVLVETSPGKRKVYTQGDSGTWQAPRHQGVSNVVSGALVGMRDFFVPRNFPQSVSPDYATTRKWMVLHDAAGIFANYLGGATVAMAMSWNPVLVGAGWAAFTMKRDQICNVVGLSFSKVAPMADRKSRAWTLFGEVVEKMGTVADTAVASIPGIGPTLLLGICTVNQLARAFGGQMRGTAEAAIGPRQARNGNIGEVGLKNSAQTATVAAVSSYLAYLAQPTIVATMGPQFGPMAVATAASLFAMFALGRFQKNLEYQPVNEAVVRKAIREREGGGAISPPDRKTWSTVPTVFEREHFQVGQSVAPLTRDPRRFAELERLYQDRNHMLEWSDGKAHIALRASRVEDGAHIGSVDRFLAVVQASHAELLAASAEYAAIEDREGLQAADRWVVAESLKRTPKDAAPLQAELAKAGWTADADALRFNDGGYRFAESQAPAEEAPAAAAPGMWQKLKGLTPGLAAVR